MVFVVDLLGRHALSFRRPCGVLYCTTISVGSHAVSFKRPLLSVYVSVSATLMLNMSETKPFSGS